MTLILVDFYVTMRDSGIHFHLEAFRVELRRHHTSRGGAVMPQTRHSPPEGALTQEKLGSPHRLRTLGMSFFSEVLFWETAV